LSERRHITPLNELLAKLAVADPLIADAAVATAFHLASGKDATHRFADG
jgi:hypothetical protein